MKRLKLITIYIVDFIALLLGFLLSFPVHAQKIVEGNNGLSYLSISNRDNITLPKGKWEIRWVGNIDFCRPENRSQCRGTHGKAVALQNIEENNPIYSMVIRYTSSTISNWRSGNCYTRITAFDDFHGTKENGLTNKCSGGWYISSPTQVHGGSWWDMVKDGYARLDLKHQRQVMLEVMVQQNNKRRIQMDILSLTDFNVEYTDGSGGGSFKIEHKMFMDWKSKYVEIMSKEIFHNAVEFNARDIDLKYFIYENKKKENDNLLTYSSAGQLLLSKKEKLNYTSPVPQGVNAEAVDLLVDDNNLKPEKQKAEKEEQERAEAQRLAAEREKAQREAQERAEAQRIAAERENAQRQARERAEAQRIAAEREKAEQEARALAEVQRLASEKEAIRLRIQSLGNIEDKNERQDTSNNNKSVDFGDWLKERIGN